MRLEVALAGIDIQRRRRDGLVSQLKSIEARERGLLQLDGDVIGSPLVAKAACSFFGFKTAKRPAPGGIRNVCRVR